MLDENLKYSVLKRRCFIKTDRIETDHRTRAEEKKSVNGCECPEKNRNSSMVLRVTDKDTMEIAEMVLFKVNQGACRHDG